MVCRHRRKTFIALNFLLALLLSQSLAMALTMEEKIRESGLTGSAVVFHTLAQLPREDSTILTVIADEQLETIVGARNFKRRFSVPRRTARNVGINITVNPQINVCGVCVGVVQNNSGRSFQRISFR